MSVLRTIKVVTPRDGDHWPYVSLWHCQLGTEQRMVVVGAINNQIVEGLRSTPVPFGPPREYREAVRRAEAEVVAQYRSMRGLAEKE